LILTSWPTSNFVWIGDLKLYIDHKTPCGKLSTVF
jgi:hypothetical protein